MENPCTLPAQLVINGDLGSQLLNAAVLRQERLRSSPSRSPRDTARHRRLAHQLQDTVTLGTAALLEHCRKLLRTAPLEIIPGSDGSTAVRVCKALEYVIDEANCRIHARAVDSSQRLITNRRGMPQRTDTALVYENIELHRPLRKPFWLRYVAQLPDGICGSSTDADVFQLPLWKESPHAAQVLDAICQQAYQRLQTDPNFLRLRAALSYRLLESVGTCTVDLALRSRTDPHGWGLDARHVCQVWRHRQLYVRMDRENPHLLPALSAWLHSRRHSTAQDLKDAVPAMRQELLDRGLPPQAWRYLVEHGPRALVYRPGVYLSWPALIQLLRQLHKSRWPAPPPRGLLGLLNDIAGSSESYMTAGDGLPGWFWNWTCREARACRGDTQRYRQLQDNVVQWAWLVRECRPRPDSNQQRSRLRWLESWASHQESITAQSNQDAWGQWLRELPWETIKRLRVVPLLSPRAVREEGLAMHNCADRYLPDCRDGNYLLLSLRQPDNGKRVALLGLTRQHIQAPWEQSALAGPCNRQPPTWVEPIANAVLTLVHRGEEAQRRSRELLRAVAARTNPHYLRYDDAKNAD